MENKEKKGIFQRIYEWFTNLSVKGLLGAIFIAFIIIIIFMSVWALPGIMSKISSSLSAALYSIFVPADKATMTIDKSIVNSGDDFNITFKKGEVAATGLFTITYACNPNVSLLSEETAGFKNIECDTPYYLLDNETSIKIKPTTTENIVRLVVNGSFENNDTQKIEKVGVVRITIKNDTLGTVVTPPVKPVVATSSPNSNQTATSSTNNHSNVVVVPAPIIGMPAPSYYGKPDLVVRTLQVGLMTNGTNFISTQNSFRYSDMIGIKFEVRNDGDANTGIWYFTASLPSISTPTYSSNAQISLRPGESIIFTLGFSNLSNVNTGLITINVDPKNMVYESNEGNNMITSAITNLSYNTNYYNNNNYNNNGYYDRYGNWISYNNYNYNNDLEVTCYAEPDDPETGDRVRWYSEASGGDGDYDYEWSGTNGLDSTSENPYKTYSSRGWKYATVNVESDGDRASATCGVYVN
jgi:hypothetical protein